MIPDGYNCITIEQVDDYLDYSDIFKVSARVDNFVFEIGEIIVESYYSYTAEILSSVGIYLNKHQQIFENESFPETKIIIGPGPVTRQGEAYFVNYGSSEKKSLHITTVGADSMQLLGVENGKIISLLD